MSLRRNAGVLKLCVSLKNSFLLAKVEALRSDEQHQRNKEQREPDEFIVAEHQGHQAYAGNIDTWKVVLDL